MSQLRGERMTATERRIRERVDKRIDQEIQKKTLLETRRIIQEKIDLIINRSLSEIKRRLLESQSENNKNRLSK